jgi:hypothetical protein
MLLVLSLVVFVLQPSNSNPNTSATSCDFEAPCAWQWGTGATYGFRLVTGQEAGQPNSDASNDTFGEYGATIHFKQEVSRM